MQIALKELLAYTEEEQDRWQAWFAAHGNAPLLIALPGEDIPTLGSMIRHALGAGLWFAERLKGGAFTEWWNGPTDDAARLFELGRSAKRALREVIEGMPADDWESLVGLQSGEDTFSISVRKAVGNALMHEIRHWAQVAVIARMNGIAPPGQHDLILSHALE